MLMRERDRERKRMKRRNPEYRKMEQERDRDRKKARRANEAFRQLEKLRDKIRKDRKRGLIVDDTLPTEFSNLHSVPVEPEVIITDVNTSQKTQQQALQLQNNVNQTSSDDNTTTNHANSNNNINNSNLATTSTSQSITQTPSSSSTASTSNSASAALAPHMTQLNKSLIYSHNFPHHPLPIPGVSLMPQLCHPMLHQNIGASLYPPNGIKQEYNEVAANLPQGAGNNGVQNGNNVANSEQDREYSLIEPEIILQTSSDVIAAPHHFHNHAHAHHLHQQHSGMFQHMSSQAHMPPHMRAHTHMPPQSHPPPPPPPPQQQQQLPPSPKNFSQHNQQQQQINHYSQNKNS